jgi:hypothetical protein
MDGYGRAWEQADAFQLPTQLLVCSLLLYPRRSPTRGDVSEKRVWIEATSIVLRRCLLGAGYMPTGEENSFLVFSENMSTQICAPAPKQEAGVQCSSSCWVRYSHSPLWLLPHLISPATVSGINAAALAPNRPVSVQLQPCSAHSLTQSPIHHTHTQSTYCTKEIKPTCSLFLPLTCCCWPVVSLSLGGHAHGSVLRSFLNSVSSPPSLLFTRSLLD